MKHLKRTTSAFNSLSLKGIHETHLSRVYHRFYLATDERNAGALDYFTKNGAVLIHDLLTKEDRREFGWPLFLTDVLSLVEQAVLARAAYFVGHAMSSVSGGIVNLRAANGVDPRTTKLE